MDSSRGRAQQIIAWLPENGFCSPLSRREKNAITGNYENWHTSWCRKMPYMVKHQLVLIYSKLKEAGL